VTGAVSAGAETRTDPDRLDRAGERLFKKRREAAAQDPKIPKRQRRVPPERPSAVPHAVDSARPYRSPRRLSVDLATLASVGALDPKRRRAALQALGSADAIGVRAALERLQALDRRLRAGLSPREAEWPVFFDGRALRVRVVLGILFGRTGPGVRPVSEWTVTSPRKSWPK
jgi:hypothetical protein